MDKITAFFVICQFIFLKAKNTLKPKGERVLFLSMICDIQFKKPHIFGFQQSNFCRAR